MRIRGFPGFVLLLAGYRTVTIDRMMCALPKDCTLITALFILISRSNSMWHPACNRLYLFTFTVKFRIYDSSPVIVLLKFFWRCDDIIGSITCDVYSSKSDEWKSSQFFVLTLLFNTPEYEFTIKCDVYHVSTTYHTLKHSRIFKELARFDMSKFITG